MDNCHNFVEFKPHSYVPNTVRTRRKLEDYQLKALESLYKVDNNPLLAIRRDLAKKLGLTQRCVQIWFQNRRAKSHRLGEAVGRGSSALKDNKIEWIYKFNTVGTSFSSSSDEDNEIIKKKPKISEYWLTTMSCTRILNY